MKRYFDGFEGVPAQDVWADISVIHNQSPERVGYPTQKPEAFLERIISASSNTTDIVLDACELSENGWAAWKWRTHDMVKVNRDEDREERIIMEIIVDAYGAEEQAMGWYYYLEDQLRFPFTAVCTQKRAISPLQIVDEVDVIGMGPEEECEREMFIKIRWDKDGLAVPLSQLKPISATPEQTREAVEDWHYWVGMGYEFG